jgi:hypothetical protein
MLIDGIIAIMDSAIGTLLNNKMEYSMEYSKSSDSLKA